MTDIDERLAYVVQGPATVIVGRDEMRALLEKVKHAETLVNEDESYSRRLRDALNRAVRAEARGNELQRDLDAMTARKNIANTLLTQVQESYARFRADTTKLLNASANANAELHVINMDLRKQIRLYVPDEPVAGLVTTF